MYVLATFPNGMGILLLRDRISDLVFEALKRTADDIDHYETMPQFALGDPPVKDFTESDCCWYHDIE